MGAADCGDCHGVPPADGRHRPDLKLTACTLCHGDTVDDSGEIVWTGAPGKETTKHMNGVVDVQN